MEKINLEAAKNEDAMKVALGIINRQLSKIHEGGGRKRMEKEHAAGKMTARERVTYLLDEAKPQIEIGAFAGLTCMKPKAVVLRAALWSLLATFKGDNVLLWRMMRR